MGTKMAINGFERIGRLVVAALVERAFLEVTHNVNGRRSIKT